MDPLPVHVVEAFTIGSNKPFTGNPAAVCNLKYDDDIPDALKQKIAMQMNLPATAFIAQSWTKSSCVGKSSNVSIAQVRKQWTLRWFTPATEVEICGHATLASAHIIFNQILQKSEDTNQDKIIFETRFKGNFEAVIDWATGHISLNLPANPPTSLPTNLLADPESWVNKIVNGILGTTHSRTIIQDVQLPQTLGCLLIVLRNTGDPLKNAELLCSLQPDFQALLTASTNLDCTRRITAVLVTIQGSASAGSRVEGAEVGTDNPRFHFYSRIFAPVVGVDEDPACGSANTILTPYWLGEFYRQGQSTNGGEILVKQLSLRQGEVRCSMIGTDRVKIVGQSRLCLGGEFYVE